MSEKISPISPISKLDLKNNSQFQHQNKKKDQEKPGESFADKYKAELDKLENK